MDLEQACKNEKIWSIISLTLKLAPPSFKRRPLISAALQSLRIK